MEIRPARPDEVTGLARLHVESFPGFFLTSLGEPFLRHLYRGFISSPDAVCLVAEQGSTLLGVVAGPVRPREFFRGLLYARGVYFAFSAIPSLLRNPAPVARRLLAALTYRGEAPAAVSGALVSTICVAPEGRGAGVAATLLERFCDEAGRRGARYVYLTTDRDANAGVNAFYTRAGFRLESDIRRDGGRVMNRYLKDLQAHVEH
jgi:ribosomal protein S18 acetylase RimI-like enzyme